MTPPPAGRLVLVPNTLDLGSGHEPDLDDVLALGALRRAATLTHWLAENAKSARAFLARVGRVAPLSLPIQQQDIVELPRARKGPANAGPDDFAALLSPMRAGHDLGLISEAGLPAVADPGAAVVQAAHAEGLVVEVLPGPSSLVMALAASGLNGQSFAFLGYLPQAASERDARIREVEALSRRLGQTQVFIETPYRNEALLAALLAQLSPSTQLSVSCGLTLPGGFTRSDPIVRWRSLPCTLPARLPAVFCLLAR